MYRCIDVLSFIYIYIADSHFVFCQSNVVLDETSQMILRRIKKTNVRPPPSPMKHSHSTGDLLLATPPRTTSGTAAHPSTPKSLERSRTYSALFAAVVTPGGEGEAGAGSPQRPSITRMSSFSSRNSGKLKRKFGENSNSNGMER